MVLHYFLGDDTIEIRDIIRPNAGRDAVPVFVRRCKLPRQGHRLHQPGVVTDRTVLNVCNSRHLLDSFKTGAFIEVRDPYWTRFELTFRTIIPMPTSKLVTLSMFGADLFDLSRVTSFRKTTTAPSTA